MLALPAPYRIVTRPELSYDQGRRNAQTPADMCGNIIAVAVLANFRMSVASRPAQPRQHSPLESSMRSHKFHVGQLVQLIPSINRNVPGGSKKIRREPPRGPR